MANLSLALVCSASRVAEPSPPPKLPAVLLPINGISFRSFPMPSMKVLRLCVPRSNHSTDAPNF